MGIGAKTGPPTGLEEWTNTPQKRGSTEPASEVEVNSVSSSRSARSNGSPPTKTTSGSGFSYDDNASIGRLPSSVLD